MALNKTFALISQEPDQYSTNLQDRDLTKVEIKVEPDFYLDNNSEDKDSNLDVNLHNIKTEVKRENDPGVPSVWAPDSPQDLQDKNLAKVEIKVEPDFYGGNFEDNDEHLDVDLNNVKTEVERENDPGVLSVWLPDTPQDTFKKEKELDRNEPKRESNTERVSEDNEPIKVNEHQVIREKKFACELCDGRFTRKGHLVRHMKTHSGDTHYTCQLCEATFTDVEAWKSHRTTDHARDTTFACETCPRKFLTRDKLLAHAAVHTGARVTCDTCGRTFADRKNLNRHTRRHTQEKSHACDACGMKFFERYQLTLHERSHTGERPFECETCSKRFASSGHLRVHARTHTGERPYACDTCDRRFPVRRSLLLHVRTHTGEKPHACGQCGRRFADRGRLVLHARLHTGERPHVCEVCSRRFVEKIQLVMHRRRHTGEKPYPCPMCVRTFALRQSLNYHMRTHARDGDTSPARDELD